MKKIFGVIFILFSGTFLFSADYQLSTHILDISTGVPAKGVNVTLSQMNKKDWKEIGKGVTDDNGRIKEFLSQEKTKANVGVYKLTFHTKPYFDSKKSDTFYPFVEVVFEIKDDTHFHVPITLSAFGYSTYRGN